MSTKLIGRKMPQTFTRSVLCAVCLMAIQGNAHASKTNILVTKKGDAVFRIADTSGVTLTLSSGDKTGDITYTITNNDSTTTNTLSGVHRNVLVHTSTGMDTLNFTNLEVPKTLNIFTGSGADSIEFFGLTVGRHLNVRTGKGDDTISGGMIGVHGSTRITTGQGNDTIEIGGVTTKHQLLIASGNGDDFVDLEEMVTSGRTRIVTGRGNDDVALTAIENSNKFQLITGKGNDNVELAALNFSARSEFRLGAGDDTLELSESGFSRSNPLFFGGKGNDTFEDEQNNTFKDAKPRIIKFEKVIDVSEPENPETPTYEIGDTGPGGGIVFQVNDTGTAGLEIMPVDLTAGAGAAYGCAGINVANVNDSVDGTNDPQSGLDKTNALINTGCSPAAMLANDYVSLNGTSDWFLPSAPELKQAIDQGVVLPNVAFPYWSSSEQTEGSAFQIFNTSLDLPPSPEDKSQVVTEDGSTIGVAPVRQFAPAVLAN